MNIRPEAIGARTAGMEELEAELEGALRELNEVRKRAERAEALFANVADAVLVAEPDGCIVDANLAACEVLGYSKEELLLKYPWDFVTSATRENILQLIQSMRPGTPVTVQRTYRSKKGDLKIMDVRLTRCGVAGRDLIIVACRDVTEQQLLEARLRRSEKNLAEGQRLTKTGSWILDFKTGNTDWSVETCRIFGFPDPPPSPHYTEFRARVHPEDREGVDRGLRESFETGEPRPLKYVFLLPNGVSKHIETISQPVRDEAGGLKLMGTVMDVTERVKAEEALRAAEHLARGQLDALKQAMASLSRESEPEKFLEHVLCITGRQLGAHSISVWEMNDQVGCVNLLAIYEESRLHIPARAEGQSQPQLHFEAQSHPVWTEFFSTGDHCVFGKIDADPPGARVATKPDGPWCDWLGSAVANPNAPQMIRRLAASGIAATFCIPMIVSGKVTGMFSIRFRQERPFRKEEIELTRAMAHQAMLAVQLMRLSEQSRETAVMAERNRMARDMHDTLAQGFTGVIMQLEAAKGATAQGNVAEVANRIERAGELARESLGEARRSVRALRPRSLQDGRISLALDNMLKRMTDGSNLGAEFKAEGDERAIPTDFEETLLRITQESLTNTVKHANARNFKATLSVGAERIQLQLVDDGIGFDPHVEHEGFGLIGMKERVDQMGGQFLIRSTLGVGTEIVVVLKNQSPPKPENGNDQG
jgi:PAS domain S-box-containing protein